jgi:LysM repeat protein
MQEFLSLFVNVYYLLGSIAITFFAMKFAFEQMQSNAGLLAVLSRVVGFVVMFLTLMLVMPALFDFGVNRSMGHMQSSQISRNTITLVKDTAELLAQQDSNIENVTYTDNTLAEAATDLYNETKAQVDNRSAAASDGAGTQSAATTDQGSAAASQQASVQPTRVPVRPTAVPTQSLQDVYNLVHPPTPTPQKGGQAYIDEFLRSQGVQPKSSTLTTEDRSMIESVITGGDGGGPQTYTVQRGDSLAKIAAKFGVDVNALCRANNIRDCNVIRKNQVLAIP